MKAILQPLRGTRTEMTGPKSQQVKGKVEDIGLAAHTHGFHLGLLWQEQERK